MRLSVIIPVYNVALFLDESVRSALASGADEVLLVDDGSTDGSGRRCDTWAKADPRIRAVHQENRGLSEARNRGIRESGGEYLLFLDGDDVLDPVETEKMLALLSRKPDVLMGLYRTFTPGEGEWDEECRNFLRLHGDTPIEDFLRAVPADGQSHYMIAPRFVVRKDFLRKHDLFFCPGIYHEDEEWTQRLLCAADRIFVTHCYFYRYRRGRPDAITAAVSDKHVRSLLTILEKSAALESRQKSGSEKARYISDRMCQLWLRCLLELPKLPVEERKPVVEMLKGLKVRCFPHLAGKAGLAAKFLVGTLGIRWGGTLLRWLRGGK